MKRDMDLLRNILLRLEERNCASGFLKAHFEGYSDECVSYHIKLLYEANLIEAVDSSSKSGFCWEAKNLTWEGHEFIEAAKNETRWSAAKSVILNKVTGLPFDLLKQLLFQMAKDAVFG